MADPLSIAAAAIAVASASLQIVSKMMKKPEANGNGNGYGKSIVELEMRLTNERHKEMAELEDMMRARLHDIGNRMHDAGMRHELKLGELDTEIKLLKQLLAKRD